MSDATFDPAVELRQAAAYRRLMQQLWRYEPIMGAYIFSVSWTGKEENVLQGVTAVLAACRTALRDYTTEEAEWPA